MKFDDKPVELYDLQGNYIKTISSATKTAEELEVARGTVYAVLHKYSLTCKGYQMKYEEDKTTIIKPFVSRQGGTKAVKQIDPETLQIINIYISAAKAGKITGADPSTIIKVCKGKLKTTHGYKWEYADE